MLETFAILQFAFWLIKSFSHVSFGLNIDMWIHDRDEEKDMEDMSKRAHVAKHIPL